MHPFRNLLLVYFGQESSLEKNPTPADWRRLFAMARQQALIGVLNAAVHRLPVSQQPPEDILAEWDKLSSKVRQLYELHERRAMELQDLLASLKLHGCILKGTGLARLYPDPSRRQGGDIDLWIRGSRKEIIEAFSKDYNVHGILYQECKADVFDDTIVELHFHPTKMYNPFCNARFQRWAERNTPISEEATLTYPGAEFNAVFCMAHMYRHYLAGGLGLRQMMDYYYVLRELPATARRPVFQTLKRLGMGRFAAATMMALQINFGLDDEFLLCSPDTKRGRVLIIDMVQMGNFGILDPRHQHAENETLLTRFLRRNRRTFSYLRLYPREVLWVPFSRLYQFLWRIFRGYR